MSNARELTNHLARLLRQERGAMADFLLALADFDRKRLWRELGHTSLFYYLHRELRLSKGAAPAASSKTRIRQQHDRHGFAVEQVRIERHTERRALGIGLRQAKVLTRVVSQRQLPTDEDHAAAQVPTREYQPDQPSRLLDPHLIDCRPKEDAPMM